VFFKFLLIVNNYFRRFLQSKLYRLLLLFPQRLQSRHEVHNAFKALF